MVIKIFDYNENETSYPDGCRWFHEEENGTIKIKQGSAVVAIWSAGSWKRIEPTELVGAVEIDSHMPSRCIDLTGMQFGKLTVLDPVGTDDRGRLRWRCTCECGAETISRGDKLRSGSATSCGCARAYKQAVMDRG